MPIKIAPTSVTYKKLIKLNTPGKIQDFLNSLPFNHEKRKETYRGVEEALKSGTVHCFEGALVAAAALSLQGQRPLLMDLRTTDKDDDHVVALFKKNGFWGAISKTNHGVLRYREPIYKTLHELALSYFHEYFLKNGEKTLRKYSKEFDLAKTDIDWINSRSDLFDLVEMLDNSPHKDLISKDQIKNLRKADKIEIKAGEIREYL